MMSAFKRFLSLAALLLWTSGSSLSWGQDSHAVIVSIDGLAAYHLKNPSLELPNIRELIQNGVWAESSETVFPSITHPSHTTIMTGVMPRIHGVLGNTMTNRGTGETFHITNRPRVESIRVRTLFDAAKEKGLTTASFFWPETKRDPSIQYNIPEAFDARGEPDRAEIKEAFLRELEEGGVPIDLFFRWYGNKDLKGAADAVLAQAAGYVIRHYRPHLLAIHILVTDKFQHTYGPDHYLSQAALTQADYCVGILREAVRAAGIAEKTTFFIVADHGFHSVGHQVNLRPLFLQAGLLDRVSLHAGGWTLFVELKDNFDRAQDGPALERVLEQVITVKGVSRIVRPEEFHSLGLPGYEEDPHIRGQYIILGDIDTHLVADPSTSSTTREPKTRPSHGHGYLPSHPRMYPALVVSGHGIRRGVQIGHVHNLDVAPTVARLLGLEMAGMAGRPLMEALAP